MKKNPELVKEMASHEKNWQGTIVSYIPKEKLDLPSDELKIKDGDVLALVTNIKGLDIVHVGFAFWKEGKLHLLHASSSAKKVIEDPKTQYESSKNPSFLLFYRKSLYFCNFHCFAKAAMVVCNSMFCKRLHILSLGRI